jgi:acetate kinase
MKQADRLILALNGGSSSIKFAVYSGGEKYSKDFYGKLDRIGSNRTELVCFEPACDHQDTFAVSTPDPGAAVIFLIDWLGKRLNFNSVRAVGHRIVHGMKFTEPLRVTDRLLEELHRTCPYDPDHLPLEIGLIEALQRLYRGLPQVACFDTAFHRTMPRVAQLLPIPRRFDAEGIQRYGFHGLSYAYLVEELERVAGVQAAGGRLILAHLGNGASMAALRDGKSVDTSMAFTPAAGLPMGTRPGDLDPGVAWQLMRAGLTADQFSNIINHESGLLGVSETSSDMRDLLERQAEDSRAAEAVELFCYQARKWIGAFAAVLGGLETLVFSGGIGEKSPEVRARICEGLQFLGIQLDETRNAANASVISGESSPVTVRVIPTDEELMIARSVYRLLLAEEGPQ